MREALQKTDLQKDEIDHVICVGGTTRIPAVKEKLKKFFNKDVNL